MFEFLAMKQRAQNAKEQRLRNYNDIACILWYKVAYDDVLAYKQKKMSEQREPFRIYDWGEHNLIYGPIKALTSAEDRERFVKTAEAELRDHGYSGMQVAVYPDAIIVTKL